MVYNNVYIGNDEVLVEFNNVIICKSFVVNINEVIELMFRVFFS